MKIKAFETRQALEEELAAKIAASLTASLALNPEVGILVSGGSTPVKLFERLSRIQLPWGKIQLALVDERFVPADSEYSNEKLVKKHLLQNFASEAQFTGMVYDTLNETENLKSSQEEYKKFNSIPLEVVLLGMGDDGHTASLFPRDPQSEEDLLQGTKKELLSTRAPVFPEQRITCSKKLILSSESVYVVIFGKSKLEILEESVSRNLPISYFTKENKVEIYYTEEK